MTLKRTWTLIHLCANFMYFKGIWILFVAGRLSMSVEVSHLCDLVLKKKPPHVVYLKCKLTHGEAKRCGESQCTVNL